MPRIRSVHWSSSFKRAFRKRIIGTPDEKLFREKLELFLEDPFARPVYAHKLTGELEGLWAFTVSYDCRVIFRFLSTEEVLLVNIGSHDEVY